jgi:hypothetical protein
MFVLFHIANGLAFSLFITSILMRTGIILEVKNEDEIRARNNVANSLTTIGLMLLFIAWTLLRDAL